GPSNVVRYLRGKYSRRVKALFIPDPVQKLQSTGMSSRRHLVSKYKRFDRHSTPAECGANADVCDRVQEISFIQRNARHVNTLLRQKVVVAVQIQCGDSQPASAARAR